MYKYMEVLGSKNAPKPFIFSCLMMLLNRKIMGIPLIFLAVVMVHCIGNLAVQAALPSSLEPADELGYRGDILENGEYKLRLKDNCELVVLKNEEEVLWTSDTERSFQVCNLHFQTDGNLVIYSTVPDVIAEWASATNKGPGNYVLVLTSKGNLAIYGSRLWETKTGQSIGGYVLLNHNEMMGSGHDGGNVMKGE